MKFKLGLKAVAISGVVFFSLALGSGEAQAAKYEEPSIYSRLKRHYFGEAQAMLGKEPSIKEITATYNAVIDKSQKDFRKEEKEEKDRRAEAVRYKERAITLERSMNRYMLAMVNASTKGQIESVLANFNLEKTRQYRLGR